MPPTNNDWAGSATEPAPRLVLSSPDLPPGEFKLASGPNSVGRGPANAIQIQHPSISGTHCRIMVNDGTVSIEDLGSTNGTFVQGVPVREAVLQHGQSLRLGQVELRFYAAAPQGSVQTGLHAPAMAEPGVALPPPPLPKTPPPEFVGAQACKFHPKMPARLHCPSCSEFFCEACVAVRQGGRKFCRHCGAECTPVLAEFGPVVEKGFAERIPGAFAYPVRGAGIIIVIVGIVLFGLLKAGAACLQYRNLRVMIFGVIIEIFSGGYLFAFMQNIVHSTSAEERELPDLPGISNFWDDVIVPFFRLLGMLLLCFGPAVGLSLWAYGSQATTVALLSLAMLAFGAIYFPMAFLAVSVLDSVAAANPLLIVPSILKTPLQYLLCLVFLGGVLGLQYGGGVLLDRLFPDGMSAGSFGALFGWLGSLVLLSFLSLYLLVVSVHLLGLLFVTRKEALGWLQAR